MSECDETLWSQYEDLGLICQRSYVEVRRARHRLTGVPVAIKVLKKQPARLLKIAEDVEILPITTKHPNIVSLFQIVETEKRIYLVLELCQTDLLHYIHRKGCLQEDEARGIFRQLLDALCYCHDQGIAHLDIKPENIMLDKRGRAIIIDFGIATRFSPGERLRRFRGTYTYMSPEMMRWQPYDAPQRDMWSMGVLLYFMVTGTHPFESNLVEDLRKNVVTGNYKKPKHLSKDLRALIKKLLSVDPTLRPTARDAMKHPWLQQGQGGSGGHELLPRQLDTDILSVMGFMHFNLSNAVGSIQQEKFDTLMATYHLLQYQAQSWVGDTAEETPVCPGTTPFPTPTDPAAFPLPLKRKRHVPASQTLSSCLELRGQPEDGQQAEHKTSWSSSCPNLYLSCPKKRLAVMPSPKCLRPVTAPGSLCPSPGPQLPEKASPQMKEEQPASTQGSHGQGSRQELPEMTTTMESTSQVDTETSNQDLPGCWEALRGSIQSCLRSWFHRRPSRNFRLFRKRVFPSDGSGQQ